MGSTKIRLFGVDIDVRARGSPLSPPSLLPIKEECVETPNELAIKGDHSLVPEPEDQPQPHKAQSKRRKRPHNIKEENKENAKPQSSNISLPFPHKKRKRNHKQYIFPMKCLCAEQDNVFIHCNRCNRVRQLGKQYCLVHMNPNKIPAKFKVETPAREIKPPAQELEQYERAKHKWYQKIYNRLHVLIDHPTKQVSPIDPFDRWEMKGESEDDRTDYNDDQWDMRGHCKDDSTYGDDEHDRLELGYKT